MLDDYGVWTFPKGQVEEGEALEQAALREVGEEVGLTAVQVEAEVGITRHRFSRGVDICNKTVHWFLMEAPPDAEVTPVRAERVRDAGWFAAQQAISMIGYRNLRPLLRRALRLLRASNE